MSNEQVLRGKWPKSYIKLIVISIIVDTYWEPRIACLFCLKATAGAQSESLGALRRVGLYVGNEMPVTRNTGCCIYYCGRP